MKVTLFAFTLAAAVAAHPAHPRQITPHAEEGVKVFHPQEEPRAVGNFKEAGQHIAQGVVDTARNMGGAMGTAAEATSDAALATGKTAYDVTAAGAHEAGKFAQGSTRYAAGSIGESFNNLVGDFNLGAAYNVNKVANFLQRRADARADTAAHFHENAAADAEYKESGKRMLGDQKEAVDNVYEGAKANLVETKDAVAENLSEKAHYVSDRVNDGVEYTKEKAHDAADATYRKKEDARKGAQETRDSLAKKAEDAQARTHERLHNVKESVKESTHNAADSAAETTEDAKHAAKGLGASIRSWFHHGEAKVADKTANLAHKVGDKADASADYHYERSEELHQDAVAEQERVPGSASTLGAATAFALAAAVVLL